jgi:hypothetical protein
MRDTPPIMSDKEANDAYYAGLAWMFGTMEPGSNPDSQGHTFMVVPGPEPTRWRRTRESPPHRYTDIRHPAHPKHAETQVRRGKILLALRTHDYIKDFRARDVPPASLCPLTHATMTALIAKRDLVEVELERLLCDMSDIEPEYKRLSGIVNDYNRAIWTTFADFWQPVLLDGEPRRTSLLQPPDEFFLLNRETQTIE